MLNALEELQKTIQYLTLQTLTLDEIKSRVQEKIEDYIKEKIISAQDLMVKLGIDLFSKNKNKPETIMVIGNSMVFDNLFK